MDEQLETARNECLRRIGRNMVMFQRVEQLLKFYWPIALWKAMKET